MISDREKYTPIVLRYVGVVQIDATATGIPVAVAWLLGSAYAK